MSRAWVVLWTLAACPALAQVSAVGDIVVVGDPSGNINGLLTAQGVLLPSPQEQFCRAAFNAARAILPDDYDGVISFTTSEDLTDLNNVWQGPPVRCAATGIGRQDAPWLSSYNSARLGQCVFMGTLGRTSGFIPGTPGSEALPSDPDADWSPSLGIPLPGLSSLTGIEMMGHEYGHHWLLGIEHDQADGRGRQHFIRATINDNPEGGQAGSPNQHYSAYADSRSVMYGDCITELDADAGTYRFAGCPRKYSHIDQYLMGLRAPNEVTPMMVLEDPTDPGQGVDALGMSRTASPRTVSGLVRHDIGADAIVRAMGPRAPAYPSSKRCWRVAFIVVLTPGQTSVPTAMMQKVERYRQRWSSWFSSATDGRGAMETRLGVECPVPPDGGVDAGEPDAGEDAGTQDAGSPDAGEPPDAGELPGTDGGEVPDAGPSKWDTVVNNDTGKIRPGCGCSSGEGAVALLALLGALWRRRARAVR